MAQAKSGDTVRVHYHGTLEDGTVFSSTREENEPFEFILGQPHVLPGFERAVVAMEEGDTKTITLPPEEAYGHHEGRLVFEIKREDFPATNSVLEIGKRLQVRLSDGDTAVVTVKAVDDETVVLDANDPLAGKTLTFEIELVKIL
jgi:peptidylprolyl isomerase